jgi:hypothetical protein
MSGNPTVGQMLDEMRRRGGIPSAMRSRDPAFKTFRGTRCPNPDPVGPAVDLRALFYDEVLDVILLCEDDVTPPRPWTLQLERLRDQACRLSRPLLKRIQEDDELAETLMGVLILAAGTAVGVLWHVYRTPLPRLWTWVLDVALLSWSILGPS